MADRHQSPTSEAPEALPDQPRATFGFIGSDDYEYYEPPPSAFERHRSPVPEYQRYEDSSTGISARSPRAPSSDIGRSPPMSEGGFTKSRPLSSSIQYSEVHSPQPETVYGEADKEAVYTPPQQHHSKVPSYYSSPVPGAIHHQNSGDRPQVWSDAHQAQERPRKRPFYKRWLFWLIIVALIIIIAVAVALGVVFGVKKSSHENNPTPSTNTTDNTTSPDNPNVNIQTSVGGYINDAYYSESGAWNGSGIAIAAANTAYDLNIYAFYQDSSGTLQYTLSDTQGVWHLLGPVNANSPKALNGTPLSAVQHQLGDELRWHLFYIDEDYIIRERVFSNTSTNGPSTVWEDGPLSKLNLKAWQSNTIGMQACYWGNYYGQWSYDSSVASAGIHIWFASDATVFQQYSWTNGTNDWNFEQQWNDLSGNAGVGCQTWYGMTEYVWFVDTNNKIAMSWRDNNRSETATPDHPVGSWTKVDIGIDDVQIDSSLGYTNYMIYQAQDTTIRGANVTWAAENTTIAQNTQNQPDTWTLQYNGQEVHALRGTHLSITAVKTVSNGAAMLAFFQEEGDDMKMYTRDAYNSGGLWQQAAQDPVAPTKS